MGNLNKFDAKAHPPEEKKSGFELLPKGDYVACIVASEMKPTKKGDGEYLSLQLEILEDANGAKSKGRLLWDILCLDHPNQETVRLAKARLSSICYAVNVLTPEDSNDLHSKPLKISVVISKRKDTGEDQNKIYSYSSAKATPETKKVAPIKREPLHKSLPPVSEDADLNDDEIPF